MDARDETRGVPLPPRPVLPEMAAARRRGTVDVVEARWQWKRAVHEIRSPGRPYPGIVPLLEAAAAQPRLRRLYPFTSHFALLFSSSTGCPWSVRGGSVEALRDGRFAVRRRDPFAVIGEVESVEEAVVMVLGLLPAGSEPVISALPPLERLTTEATVGPTGRFLYARHADGAGVEYVEWTGGPVDRIVRARAVVGDRCDRRGLGQIRSSGGQELALPCHAPCVGRCLL
ncbi:DUF6193 family natural product biosynthesis protein [Streptomyces sp. 4F14]|uniref:DUF6193 family natural product biosynthesis protein n=1 Tax=Streptomyces sp. 4F14 TaxID=3394380 RepID=UPI003A86ED13